MILVTWSVPHLPDFFRAPTFLPGLKQDISLKFEQNFPKMDKTKMCICMFPATIFVTN